MRIAALALPLLLLLPVPAVAGPPPPTGRWANPRHTIEVSTGLCGRDRMCGKIVWADATALSDARAAKVDSLVGTELLQDYRAETNGEWSGRVYVPDMGRSFASHIRQTAPDELTIAGCLIGHWLCKSQVWHRVG